MITSDLKRPSVLRISIKNKIILTFFLVITVISVCLFLYINGLIKDYALHQVAVSIISAIIFSVVSSAIIINFFLSGIISEPIERISGAARNIAGGDFSRTLPLNTNDEIGDLAYSFNSMTEAIRAKMKYLSDDRARMEAVLLNMSDGVMVLGSNGKILLMNRAAKDMLPVEVSPEGKRPIEVIRNADIQEVADKVIKLASGVESREISIYQPVEKQLIIYGTSVLKDKSIEGAVLVFHDVTNIKRLEKLRKDFVANVSHELRTPVSNIKGFAETLMGGAVDDKENAREFIKIISDNADSLAKLIEDLLDLSKIESGKSRLIMEGCSLGEIADKVVSQISLRAVKKNIILENKIEGNLPRVLADKTSISQVFFNLIDNAVNYTGQGGSVIIEALSENDFVRVNVKDSGIGISEKDIPRVFERFYRVDKARSRESGGTGLGLSIVKHIVEDHGGKVFVESLIGQGSTFSFTIPKY